MWNCINILEKKQAGRADGIIKTYELDILYDCTLREDYKEMQIDNYVSQINQNTIRVEKMESKLGSLKTLNASVRRINHNFFAVTAVHGQGAVGAHGRANHADAADAGFARGQYVIVAVAVVDFGLGFNDVRRFVVFVWRNGRVAGVADGLHVFHAKGAF